MGNAQNITTNNTNVGINNSPEKKKEKLIGVKPAQTAATVTDLREKIA